jgi:DNA-nicking Smr family endonuclease
MDDNCINESEPVELPIDGILDLHTFNPKDVKDLIPEYIDACRQRKIFRIRIIHGKGTGMLRETVRSILKKLPDVISFETPSDASSWGATIVHLRDQS